MTTASDPATLNPRVAGHARTALQQLAICRRVAGFNWKHTEYNSLAAALMLVEAWLENGRAES